MRIPDWLKTAAKDGSLNVRDVLAATKWPLPTLEYRLAHGGFPKPDHRYDNHNREWRVPTVRKWLREQPEAT